MQDKIEKIGNSTIQHGKFSDRIYLMKLQRDDFPGILSKLDRMMGEKVYTKIFAKIPGWAKRGFEANGYQKEAFTPGFYNGKSDALFMAKYFSKNRGKLSPEEQETIRKVIETARGKATQNPRIPDLPEDCSYRIIEEKDRFDVVEVYKVVFETYPFPIHDPSYILETMRDNIVYFGIWKGDRLVAVSSSEMDTESQNVEMTDFATLPEYRGHGFALFLLEKMEREMTKRGILTSFTIARAVSFGMNITFAKMGYRFGGTLIHNTNISGSIESMNVWYKPLS